ncbi:MAG TPA: asparagine--tRNA ligase [Candidatus Bathyarchaeia archaeon]|nr:asparagine--tRNA ligase [Candidatus Bathyarchaeia archaeon]
MVYTVIDSILSGKVKGKKVEMRGWVYRKRESKDTIFLVIRDASGIIQTVIKKDSPAWAEAEKATIESVITLAGSVKLDKRAPGGHEIAVDKLEIMGLAENFPIAKDKSEEFLRNVRHLWLRSRKMNTIMKIRSEVLKYVHEYFDKQRFAEVSPPMFISSAVEGGATLFGVKYFDDVMYLTQSAQLHLEVLIYSLEKVYCVAPSFRAEKSRTIRHLTEYWHVESEEAFSTIDDLMRLEEGLVSFICQSAARKCKKHLEALGLDPKELAKIKTPFPKITYDEAIQRLQKAGCQIQWGEDFGFNEEKVLTQEFGGPVFVYKYPKKIKAFYVKAYPDRPETVMSADLLVPRIGELSTGGARVDSKEEMLRNLQEFGLRPEDYEWYIDLRRYGSVPHTGFGMGVERLLAWMLNLESVFDSIPFPRTTRRSHP